MFNGAMGLLLVLLALGLLLELRVAFWTAIGIPVSILGSLILLPAMGATINMLSLFGFIVTLGIVVDDAVVVGEDIFHKISEGMSRQEAAIAGVREMTLPVIFAVATNIIAFLPLLVRPGRERPLFRGPSRGGHRGLRGLAGRVPAHPARPPRHHPQAGPGRGPAGVVVRGLRPPPDRLPAPARRRHRARSTGRCSPPSSTTAS